MKAGVNYSGLVIAGIGFFLTRFTVTLALYEDPFRFYLAGIVPLMLGLGLAAFGIALAVADVEPSLVGTTTRWCVIGFGTMLVLVSLTLLGSTTGGVPAFTTVRSQTYLSNFLIGGSVGGTLTGLYAARNHQQRDELRQQARQLEVLNRMLRHEVLNAVNVIQGYATISGEEDSEASDIIREHSTTIEQTIEEVNYLTRSAATGPPSGSVVDLHDCLGASVETVTEAYPDARISVERAPDDVAVPATDRLEQLFEHLFVDAIVRNGTDAPSVAVTVTAARDGVRVSVSDDGPGLPERQRDLLETGEVRRLADRGTGFRLNMVRLLVESYGGSIETDVAEAGTTITVVLPRADTGDTDPPSDRTGVAGIRPAVPELVVAFGAAVIAGVSYGIASELLGGSIAAIGVFYGTASPVVGWITHEFHSVVFGFVFAGLVSIAPPRYHDDVLAYVAIGTGWALVLWTVAAGIVAPIWLRLLGFSASIPNLSSSLLVSHLAWGVSLGVLTALGYRYVSPRIPDPVDG